MLSKLVLTGAILLSLSFMSDPDVVKSNKRLELPQYRLSDLFNPEIKQEKMLRSYNFNQIFIPPVSNKPVDVTNLNLSDIFKYGP